MLTFNYFFKSILRSWKHQPAVQFSAVLVLSCTFAIVFSFFLIFSNLERLVVSWGSDLEMNIYLEDSTSANKTEEIIKELQSMNKFKQVKYLNKEEVAKGFFEKMARFIPDLNNDADFLNMVPASFIGKLDSTVKVDELPQLSNEIIKINGVEDVSYGQEWVQNFSVFLSAIHKTGWSVITILLLGGLFVIGYSIKMILMQRREEIEVLELVGATANVIRAPYVVEGAFLGFLSAVIAIIICLALFSLQDKLLFSEVSFWGISNSFLFYKWYQILILLVVGALLGAGTAFLFVQKINSGWAALNGQN